MPIYLAFFDRPNSCDRTLRGDVKAKGYEGWIELQSAQFGSHGSITNNSSGTQSATPSPTEMTVTKLQDGASTALFRESLHGQGKLAMIVFVGNDGTVGMTLVLRDTLISGYSVSGKASGGGDRPRETLTLNFGSITYNAKDKAPDVTRQSPQQLRGAWDLAHARGA